MECRHCKDGHDKVTWLIADEMFPTVARKIIADFAKIRQSKAFARRRMSSISCSSPTFFARTSPQRSSVNHDNRRAQSEHFTYTKYVDSNLHGAAAEAVTEPLSRDLVQKLPSHLHMKPFR